MSVKDIKIKNHTYYFFDDIINMKDFGPNNIEIDDYIETILKVMSKDFYLLYWICDNQKRPKNV